MGAFSLIVVINLLNRCKYGNNSLDFVISKMQRRRLDGKVSGKSGLGSAVGSGATGAKALDLKEKKEKQEVVVAALSVISNATNKHLLQQADTQNAARAIAVNLEEPVVVEKIWEKKGLNT